MSDERVKVQQFLEMFHGKIANNCTIVDPVELPSNHLLHISMSDKVKLFYTVFYDAYV